jgi:hypothetical protein
MILVGTHPMQSFPTSGLIEGNLSRTWVARNPTYAMVNFKVMSSKSFLNSLIPIRVRTGTKNSRPLDFLL